MRFKITAFLFISILSSCIKVPDVPKELINKTDMSKLNADIILAETVAYSSRVSKDSQKILFTQHYKPIVLDQHGISQALYDSSIAFYNRHPVLMSEVADTTEKILKERLDNFKTSQ